MPGGFLGTDIIPSTSSATGRWEIDDVYESRRSNTFPRTPFFVEYLVIAGGGGGASAGSNGGAGGYRSSVIGEMSGGGSSAEQPLSINFGSQVSVLIGGGGSGGPYAGNGGGTVGSGGSNSQFGSITSIGGGRGASYDSNVSATSGGSGGGGAGTTGAQYGAAGTSGQGYSGGNSGGGAYSTASGGGAGGSNGTGVSSSITGVSVTRAAGNTPLTVAAFNNANHAPANSGSSGPSGGVWAEPWTRYAGGNGGSGVVIIRYSSLYPELSSISAGLSYTFSNYENYRIYSFNSGSGTVTF